MKKSLVAAKSYSFALNIIRLYTFLTADRKEFVLSKQLLRSGTAVGALIREAEHAQSKKDFLSKMNIALKEANETQYWLELLKDSAFIGVDTFDDISAQSIELVKLLTSIVKTTKSNLGIN
ncbi:four helix bundle protein [Parapedobacter defluvii]|nr:four helix bundle protein [Parapedobacter defluvii]RQP17739.1 MAG: four helix bundle protein [Parapedobacter sp.]